jgi:hypothetical protein
VEVYLKNGRQFSKDLRLSPGSYKLPLQETITFFQETSLLSLGESRTKRVTEKILHLEDEGDIPGIGNLLT